MKLKNFVTFLWLLVAVFAPASFSFASDSSSSYIDPEGEGSENIAVDFYLAYELEDARSLVVTATNLNCRACPGVSCRPVAQYMPGKKVYPDFSNGEVLYTVRYASDRNEEIAWFKTTDGCWLSAYRKYLRIRY